MTSNQLTAQVPSQKSCQKKMFILTKKRTVHLYNMQRQCSGGSRDVNILGFCAVRTRIKSCECPWHFRCWPGVREDACRHRRFRIELPCSTQMLLANTHGNVCKYEQYRLSRMTYVSQTPIKHTWMWKKLPLLTKCIWIIHEFNVYQHKYFEPLK